MIKYIFLLLVAGILYLPFITAHNLWIDELFTMRIIQGSFTDIIRDTIAQDTHTPFYYLLLKTATLLFNSSDPTVGRLFSLFWLFMTALLGVFPIRRLFGDKVALPFVCLILFTPVSLFIGVDIRMYSMALFFMTGLIIYAYTALQTNHPADKLKFALMTFGALYCHYFTTMGVGIVYAAMGLWLMKKHHSLGQGFMWFWGIIAINALAFMPWLYAFCHQTTAVYDIWWPTITATANTFIFLVTPTVWITLPLGSETALTLLMIVLYGCIGYGLLFRKKLFSKNERFIFILSSCILCGILIIAASISFAFRPILAWRYTIPFLGAIYLAAAFVLCRTTLLRYALILVLFGVLISAWPLQLARMWDSSYDEMAKKLKALPQDTLFAATESRIYMEIRHLLPDRPLIQLYLHPEQIFFNNPIERAALLNRFESGSYSSVILIYAGECSVPIKTLYYPNAKYCLSRLSPELFQEEILEKQISSDEQP